MDDTPISINGAAAAGISRIRKPNWSNPMDHLELYLTGGSVGPWVNLYCPMNQSLNGRDPVKMLITEMGDLNKKDFLPYAGPLPESDEYKAAVKRYSAT